MNALVATDGSKYGEWALAWLARLPFFSPPTVRVVHVVDVAGLRAPFMIQSMVIGTDRYMQAELKRMETAAKVVKSQSAETLATLGLAGTVIIDRGGVADTIIKHATRGATNLVSVGSRGLDAMDRFFLGSTSEKVIHHAPCSVLVVKEPPKAVEHVLLAIDGSPASDKALRFFLRNFSPGHGQTPPVVIVVHVLPLNSPKMREAGRAMVRRSADQLAKVGFQARKVLLSGKPAQEILTLAKRQKTHLIVTGAKGLGTMRRTLLGSVSTRLVQSVSCSVLVVR